MPISSAWIPAFAGMTGEIISDQLEEVNLDT